MGIQALDNKEKRQTAMQRRSEAGANQEFQRGMQVVGPALQAASLLYGSPNKTPEVTEDVKSPTPAQPTTAAPAPTPTAQPNVVEQVPVVRTSQSKYKPDMGFADKRGIPWRYN